MTQCQKKCHSNYIPFVIHQNLKGTSTIAQGKLNYLSQTTRPNILYMVHQAAKYSADPRLEHG
ncbi:hypothetical protein ACHAW6_000446 [Cyclotella cf. meneghiniana]